MAHQDRTLTVDDAGTGHRSAPPDSRAGLFVAFTEGTLPGEGIYQCADETTIGRHFDQHVFIEDRGMSRCHAVVRRQGSSLSLHDLGSHNGTFVNGVKLVGSEAQELSIGDLVRCGKTLMLVVGQPERFKGWARNATETTLIGGPAIQAIVRSVCHVAPQNIGVLVSGESGTGKELVARLLHDHSGRSGPMVVVNCAAVPEELFEAELFGVRKGSFTGALTDRPGLMRQAAGGTLFLDEIGELPLSLQPKLLRVVETRRVRPVGEDRSVPLDIRLVAATNRDLRDDVDRGLFRADLFHRINGATLQLPPLRERPYDVMMLARHFLAVWAEEVGSAALPMTADFAEAMLLYSWPGNVRELKQTIMDAAIKAHGEGSTAMTKELVIQRLGHSRGATDQPGEIRQALARAGGHVAHAAADLGISRAKLYRLIKVHAIDPERYR